MSPLPGAGSPPAAHALVALTKASSDRLRARPDPSPGPPRPLLVCFMELILTQVHDVLFFIFIFINCDL